MAAKRGETNPPRLPNGTGRMEFIAIFDEIKGLWTKGYSAAGLYRKLLAGGKISMTLRTFQKLCERHLRHGIGFNEIRTRPKKGQVPLPLTTLENSRKVVTKPPEKPGEQAKEPKWEASDSGSFGLERKDENDVF